MRFFFEGKLQQISSSDGWWIISECYSTCLEFSNFQLRLQQLNLHSCLNESCNESYFFCKYDVFYYLLFHTLWQSYIGNREITLIYINCISYLRHLPCSWNIQSRSHKYLQYNWTLIYQLLVFNRIKNNERQTTL